MKLCQAGHENKDDAVTCSQCGDSSGFIPVADQSPPREPNAPLPFELPRAQEQQDPPSTSGAADTATTAKAASAEDDEGDLLNASNQTTVMEELRRLADGARRPRIIVLFGHSMSGKSFFMLRTKLMANTRLHYVQVKPPVRQNSDGRYHVPGTAGMHLHLLKRNKDDAIVIVDLAGEDFEKLIAEDFSLPLLKIFEALANADGFIFMMPALETIYPDRLEETKLRDVIVQAPEGRNRARELLTNLHLITDAIAWLSVRSNRDMPTAERANALHEFLRVEHISDASLDTCCDKPALLLFSKSDIVERMAIADPEMSAVNYAASYDFDPWRQLADSEHSMLIYEMFQRFTRPKVDFVAAAHGHKQSDGAGDYNKMLDTKKSKAIGVAEAIRWIRDEIDHNRSRRAKFWRRCAGPIRLRKLLDPSFAAAFRRDD